MAAVTLVWFRHDLRLDDNPALLAAAARGRVVPVFIWAPDEEAPWQPGAASRWWLHQSLASLAAGLEKLGLWQDLQGRIARAANVRAALALVVRGEASVGVVYESDAKTEPRVRILDHFPAASHPPVRYMMAAIEKQPAPDVGVYMDFLTSASVRAILTKHGFLPPRDPRH